MNKGNHESVWKIIGLICPTTAFAIEEKRIWGLYDSGDFFQMFTGVQTIEIGIGYMQTC